MKTRVQKWGNSLAVRIPRSVVEESRLSVGTEVEVGVEDGRIVVVPVTPRLRGRALLEDLLSRVTDESIHGEISTGAAIGREVWWDGE